MDYYNPELSQKQNTQAAAIAKYIAMGETSTQQALGLEIEHFLVSSKTGQPMPYYPERTGTAGVSLVLQNLHQFYPDKQYVKGPDEKEHLVGLSGAEGAISLEPGAQIEVSLPPQTELSEIRRLYELFYERLQAAVAESEYEIVTRGLLPNVDAHSVSIIPKQRYYFMDKYFATLGESAEYAPIMMRNSAAVQVSIDFASEEDAVNKLRVANALAPLFGFITDTSEEGELDHTSMWDKVDPARSLTSPALFDEDFGYAKYATGILRAPAIMSTDTYLGVATVSDSFAEELDAPTIEHILSTVFYDVRLKEFIEIRLADSVPEVLALGYVALIKAIFYTQSTLEHYTQLFEYCDAAQIANAKTALHQNGYDATVYNRAASEWLDEFVRFVRTNLLATEQPYFDALAGLIIDRKHAKDYTGHTGHAGHTG